MRQTMLKRMLQRIQMGGRTHALAISLLMMAALSGCATMSPEECLQANWEEIGFNDAAEGYSSARSADHREACAEAGVALDFEAYRAGYELGLPVFCTLTRGYETADHGGDFAEQCDRNLFPDYARGYAEGRELYQLRSEINALEDDKREKERQSDALLEQIGNLQMIRDESSDKDERRKARQQLPDLENLYRSLAQDIAAMAREIELLRADADAHASSFYRNL